MSSSSSRKSKRDVKSSVSPSTRRRASSRGDDEQEVTPSRRTVTRNKSTSPERRGRSSPERKKKKGQATTTPTSTTSTREAEESPSKRVKTYKKKNNPNEDLLLAPPPPPPPPPALAAADVDETQPHVKRGRGRPKGSKNKKSLKENVAPTTTQHATTTTTTTIPAPKRIRDARLPELDCASNLLHSTCISYLNDIPDDRDDKTSLRRAIKQWYKETRRRFKSISDLANILDEREYETLTYQRKILKSRDESFHLHREVVNLTRQKELLLEESARREESVAQVDSLEALLDALSPRRVEMV